MTDFSVPMPKRSSLPRRTFPIRARKKAAVLVGKLGIVRLRGKAMEDLRLDCFLRDGGRCIECRRELFYETLWPGHEARYHMAHIRNKRMYGDTLENVRALCGDCHRAEHGNPKPKGS